MYACTVHIVVEAFYAYCRLLFCVLRLLSFVLCRTMIPTFLRSIRQRCARVLRRKTNPTRSTYRVCPRTSDKARLTRSNMLYTRCKIFASIELYSGSHLAPSYLPVSVTWLYPASSQICFAIHSITRPGVEGAAYPRGRYTIDHASQRGWRTEDGALFPQELLIGQPLRSFMPSVAQEIIVSTPDDGNFRLVSQDIDTAGHFCFYSQQ